MQRIGRECQKLAATRTVPSQARAAIGPPSNCNSQAPNQRSTPAEAISLPLKKNFVCVCVCVRTRLCYPTSIGVTSVVLWRTHLAGNRFRHRKTGDRLALLGLPCEFSRVLKAENWPLKAARTETCQLLNFFHASFIRFPLSGLRPTSEEGEWMVLYGNNPWAV